MKLSRPVCAISAGNISSIVLSTCTRGLGRRFRSKVWSNQSRVGTPGRAWPFWKRAKGDVFFAAGSFGQFVFVDRRRDLVIVHQAERRRLFSNPVTDETISPLLDSILAAFPRE